MSGRGRHFDVIVVGAGLSGLTTAALLAEQGARVGVIAKGGGYLHFTSGCVDVLARDARGEAVRDPLASAGELIGRHGDHPYALAGTESVLTGLDRFRDAMAEQNLPYGGDPHVNVTLPTAIGSTRSTCLLPVSMAAGDVRDVSPMLIVGLRGFRDFYPPYLAANLSRLVPFPVRHVYLDLPRFRDRHHLLPLDVARALDDPAARLEIGRMVRSNLGDAGRVGFPAVLGLDRHREAVLHLGEILERPIFEISTLPPSVAGIRVATALRRRLLRQGARVEIGFWVQGRIEDGRAMEIAVESAGQPTTHGADAFILATGGTGSGGIAARPDGSLRETVFGLPVEGPKERSSWYHERFLGAEPQPISLAGIAVDERMRPRTPDGEPVQNVFVTASNLPHWDPVHEGSGEGVALATAHRAALEVMTSLGRHTSAPTSADGRSSPAGERAVREKASGTRRARSHHTPDD